MKVKILGPKPGRSLLFDEAKEFLKRKALLGVMVLEGDDPKGEQIFWGILLWENYTYTYDLGGLDGKQKDGIS